LEYRAASHRAVSSAHPPTLINPYEQPYRFAKSSPNRGTMYALVRLQSSANERLALPATWVPADMVEAFVVLLGGKE